MPAEIMNLFFDGLFIFTIGCLIIAKKLHDNKDHLLKIDSSTIINLMLNLIKKITQNITQYIKRDPMMYVLLFLAGSFFFLYYLTDPARPAGIFRGFLGFRDIAQYPLGWFGYYDQGEYLKIAHTLASFNFSELNTTYSYGLGYPLVAVPALWLGFNTDPFVFFNFATYLFTVYAVYRVAKELLSPFAGMLAGFATLFATPLIVYTAQPWNSSVCLFGMSGILLVMLKKNVNWKHGLIVGFLAGWAFAARYIDVIWLVPLAAASIYRGSFKQWMKVVAFMIVGILLWVLPVLYSHYKIFGSPLKTPYVNHIGLKDDSNDQQLNAYKLERIPNAAVGMFLGPRLAGAADNDRGWLITMFWALTAIPGAIIVFRRSERRLFWGTFITVTIAAYLFYLSFRASSPTSLKYGVLHYFKMFWPGLIILSVAFFDRILQKQVIEKPKSLKKSKLSR